MAGPAIYDVDLLNIIGIDAKQVIPKKRQIPERQKKVAPLLKDDIKKQLRIFDEQDAVRRYIWYNLPKGVTGELIERVLYYRGQGIFFYSKDEECFRFLPYTLDTSKGEGLDVYGRFQGVRPMPFNGRSETDNKGHWITMYSFEPRYDVALEEDFYDENGVLDVEKAQKFIGDSCVIIRDYTEQQSQNNISRQILQDPLLDTMSEIIPFCKTALLNSTGVMGMKVEDEKDAANVLAASASLNHAALTQQKYIPITATLNLEELTGGNVAKAQEFFLALESLDNYRLSLYGLDNGGLFQKNSHMLESEQQMNARSVGLILQDGLLQRQAAADIINSIWDLHIWCMISENLIGLDMNGDGMIGENMDQSGEGQGNQDVTEVTEE